MTSNKKYIKIPDNIKGETSVKAKEISSTKNNIVFSFSFFNGSSIHINGFNNFYFNEYDSKKAISDFFETLRTLSKYKNKELLEPTLKKQFHYNEFSKKDIVERINKVLINGYGMSKGKVEEFENLYFEFSFANGKRAIGTRIYDNVFEILFIDNNHMICIETSRNVKIKEKCEYPGLFGRINNEIESKEYEKLELLKILIEDLKNGKYSCINDFIKEYEELFGVVEL